jgi:hypothetical protein
MVFNWWNRLCIPSHQNRNIQLNVHRLFEDLEKTSDDDSEDKVMFDSVIQQPHKELNDIGLLLTQPSLSTSNQPQITGPTSTENPDSPITSETAAEGVLGTGSTSNSEGQDSAGVEQVPANTDNWSIGALAWQGLPAIKISSPVEDSASEEDMKVDAEEVSKTGAASNCGGPDLARVEQVSVGTDNWSIRAPAGQGVPAIKVSSHVEVSRDEEVMEVDNSSLSLLPICVFDQQEPKETERLISDGPESHKDIVVQFVGHLQQTQFC